MTIPELAADAPEPVPPPPCPPRPEMWTVLAWDKSNNRWELPFIYGLYDSKDAATEAALGLETHYYRQPRIVRIPGEGTTAACCGLLED